MTYQLLLVAIQTINNHPFQRVTDGATGIQHLFIWFLIAATFVFIAVIGYMIYSMIKYRHRGEGDDRQPPQTHSNIKLEASLTFASIVLVSIFAVLCIKLMTRMNAAPDGRSITDKADIIIIGHQWWWEAKYPKLGFTTANEVHFPVGKKLLVKFKSADVVHDWWLLALGQKMDMFPGHFNHMWTEINKPGNYWGTCAEYCGKQHAHMQIHVIAQTPKDFKKWADHQAQPAAPPSNRMEALGSALFNQSTCGNCHTINGNPSAHGNVGPDLTHLASRKTILTFAKNNSANLHRWVNHPQEMKEGAHMPSFRFNKEQLDAVVAYLEGLK